MARLAHASLLGFGCLMPDSDPPHSPSPRTSDQRRGLLWFVRNLFTEIRPGEGRVASLLLFAVFFLLASLYMLKVAREAKVLRDRGFYGVHGPTPKALARACPAKIMAVAAVATDRWGPPRVTPQGVTTRT